MLLRYLSVAAVALQSAHAFQDASPFFLFSTDKLHSPETALDASVASAQTLKSGVEYQLKDCPSDTYVVVSQPGVSANDLSASQSTPHLRRRVLGKDSDVKSIVTVNNVVGSGASANALMPMIMSMCGSQGSDKTFKTLILDGEKGEIPTKAHNAIHVRFPELPANKDDREAALLQADSYLNSLLATLDSYTVLYTTTPSTAEPALENQHPDQYEMDEPYPSGMHIDLKRDVDSHVRRASNSSNLQSNLPLFEKYQFLSAGIFMGGAVTLLLFVLLYIAINAIAGLEVSYMAFSKEMGPAAQKKQQ